MLLNHFIIDDVFEKDFDNTLKTDILVAQPPDLLLALSSTLTYDLANAQTTPTQRVWKNLQPHRRVGVETI